MKIQFSHNGFHITGEFTPGTADEQFQPGDDPEFEITSIEVEDHDELLAVAEAEYGEAE